MYTSCLEAFSHHVLCELAEDLKKQIITKSLPKVQIENPNFGLRKGEDQNFIFSSDFNIIQK